MIDFFYRFIDQSTMFEMIAPLGMVSYYENNNVPFLNEGTHQYAAFQVGEIPGYDGWHLNIRQIDPDFDLSSLVNNQVFPPHPVCVWA